MDADRIHEHILHLLIAIGDHQYARLEWHAELVRRTQATRTICEACGCLCWPWERCPGCAVRRLEGRTAA